MTLLRWRDSLALGAPVVDADHQRLFALLDRIRFLDLAGDDAASVGDALSELLLYTQTHFRREEQLMELGGFPGRARHRVIHQQFTDRVTEIVARFRAQPRGFQVREVCEMLSEWLVDHVLGEDMQVRPYVIHLREAQVAA